MRSPFCICHLVSISANVNTSSGQDDPHIIQIRNIISDETTIRCDVSMDAAVIAKTVGDTYKPFVDGDVAVGIGSVLELALKALFGGALANSNSTTK